MDTASCALDRQDLSFYETALKEESSNFDSYTYNFNDGLHYKVSSFGMSCEDVVRAFRHLDFGAI